MTREVGTALRRVVAAPSATLYGILTDTDRFDRITGVTPSRYTFELLDPHDPTSRTRIGHAKNGIFPIHFAEEGEYWIGTFLRGERRFRGGLARWVRRGFLEVKCEASGPDTTKLDVRVGLEPTWIGWLLVPYLLLLNRRIVRRYVSAVAHLAEATVSAKRPAPDEPPAIHARYALAAHFESRGVNGPRTPPTPLVEERFERFRKAPVSDRVRERVIALVRDSADESVIQLQPLAIAALWGEDGRETLKAFLHAARAGLFDLEWQVDCPACRVGTDVVPRLDEIRGRIHCEECDVSFDVDFASHVHATFTVNPAIRPVKRVVYCATSPFFRPHVQGYMLVGKGQTRDLGPLPDGDVLVRARGVGTTLVLSRTGEGVVVGFGASGFVRQPDEILAGTLRITNRSPYPLRLIIERAGWKSPLARGSLVMTIPGFVDMFGTDAPAAGLPIEVGRLAVLFTDVVGSVEMYQRVGDARAFAYVQQHWRDVAQIVAAHDGSIVKTLGDGVFAAFTDLGNAAKAALAIMAAAQRLSNEHMITFAIRCGCNEGPCFIVRANDRVDLFGSTINLAARLSGVAGGQQLAMLATLAESVRSTLANEPCEIEPVTSAIKGLPGQLALSLVTYKGHPVSGTPRLARLKTDPAGLS